MSVYNGNPWVGDIYHWVLFLGIDFDRIVATEKLNNHLLLENDYYNITGRIALQEWFDRKQKKFLF